VNPYTNQQQISRVYNYAADVKTTADAAMPKSGGAFTTFPTTPAEAPDADYEVANKKYVDDAVTPDKGIIYRNSSYAFNSASEGIKFNAITDNVGTSLVNSGATNAGIKVSRAGTYLIIAQILWESSTGGTYRWGELLKNSTRIGFSQLPPFASGNMASITIATLTLAANDVISYKGGHDVGSSINVLGGAASDNYTFIKIVRLGN
jgi:hypothetical protein